VSVKTLIFLNIYTKKVLKDWDLFTIHHEPVTSLALMKRAAESLTKEVMKLIPDDKNVVVLCGNGNNGGDGLCITQILRDHFYHVEVWYFPVSAPSEENKYYFEMIKKIEEISIKIIDPLHNLPPLSPSTIMIDAIMGYGFKGPWKNGWDKIIRDINLLPNTKIAIDLPSGMNDDEIQNNVSIIAGHTLTIEAPKKCFFYPENAQKTGKWSIVPIGLHPDFPTLNPSPVVYIENNLVSTMIKPRSSFDLKWTFGHVALFAGSDEFPGAALMAGKACTRSGAGLTTCFTSSFVGQCLIPYAPEVMFRRWDWSIEDKNVVLSPTFSVLAIGPGTGFSKTKENILFQLLKNHPSLPKVIDADALNMMATADTDFSKLCQNAVLTPHTKEFDRLFGPHSHILAREETALQKAKEWHCIIILKGHYTRIFTPEGKMYINSTGNPGMAKGGSGDVLTGMIAALLAQKYEPEEAAVIGTFIHGMAGDYAADKNGQISMLPTDIIDNVGLVYNSLKP
jgi:NAD(P)H-hydrate epimerase